MAQSFKQNLEIHIVEGHTAILYLQNSPTPLASLQGYMNDTIPYEAIIYNSYYDASIGVETDVASVLIGVNAVAMIKVGNSLLKQNCAIVDDKIQFQFTLPYFEEEVQGFLQIVLEDVSGDIIHTPIIPINIEKPLGDINTLQDSSDSIKQLLKEKTRKTFTIEPSQLIKEETLYGIILEHNIVSIDGNLFVSVINGQGYDVKFTKTIMDETHLKILVSKQEQLNIALRK